MAGIPFPQYQNNMLKRTYLYAFTWADCPNLRVGPGIDTRFEVELVRQGQLAGVTSRVGLDRFDAERFETKTPSNVRWLDRVATRHDQVIREVAADVPVMPLGVGTLFHNRPSLLWRMSRCEAKVAAFLDNLGDRQEWVVKVFKDASKVTPNASHPAPPPPHFCFQEGTVAQCLVAPVGKESLHDLQNGLRREVHDIESVLAKHADRCRVRFLPESRNGHRKKMIYKAAYLLSRSALDWWSAAVRDLQETKRHEGLVLEVTGPSPPYHFCPSAEMSTLRPQPTADADRTEATY